MSHSIYAELSWLPRPPADFSAQCRGALEGEGELGKAFRTLASHALDENQLNRLARTIDKARDGGRSLAPMTTFKLGLISNATTSFIAPALVATAARHGIALDCIVSDFGQVMQDALSPASKINQAKPDAVLIALDYHGLPLRATMGDAEAADATVSAAFNYLSAIRDAIRRNSGALCIVQTVPRPVEPCFGNMDFVVAGTPRRNIDALNRRIADSIAGTPDLLLDVAGLAETVGLAEWHDPTMWNMAKLPFASSYLPLYADNVCRLIAAARGLNRRCLVLDLDNTLWGGVIGDDGLEGITIGQGDPTGEAHLAVQQTAMMLRNRGVVLAVSSKNNDDVARTPFQKHPEMVLREEHIAVFRANWDDKGSNIKTIADTLSLGTGSMAFLDDNPAERELVRRFLPDVAVPELPRDPALYARTLLAGGYFEAIAFSDEDRKRADFYRDNARRASLQGQAGDVDEYLKSLNMVITFQPFDPTGRSRISQLINKSNQFNLTTRRYSETDVERAELDPACFTLQVRLTDTFGDNGMISAIICRQRGRAWHVDTWLMSCRVLGRKVEGAVLGELLAHARQRGIQRLVGEYVPTERNKMVEDHYAKLGFTQTARSDAGATQWELMVADAAVEAPPMEVQRLGFAVAEQAAA
jgi:FkbH-like protein